MSASQQHRNRELQRRIASLEAENAKLRAKLTSIIESLDKIVVDEGEDAGVILLSDDSPTHYSPLAKCQVYDYECFSPLGDALVALAKLAKGTP